MDRRQPGDLTPAVRPLIVAGLAVLGVSWAEVTAVGHGIVLPIASVTPAVALALGYRALTGGRTTKDSHIDLGFRSAGWVRRYRAAFSWLWGAVALAGAAIALALAVRVLLGAAIGTDPAKAIPAAGSAAGFLTYTVMPLVVGLILIFPAVMTPRGKPEALRRRVERIALLVLNALVMGAVLLTNGHELLVLIAPGMVICAIRLGIRSTVVALFTLAATIGVATALGVGPVSHLEPVLPLRILFGQILVLAAFISLMPIAGAIDHRRRLEERLEAQQKLTGEILESMREIVFRTNAQGQWTFLNPAWYLLTGYTVEESLGWKSTRLLLAADVERARGVYPDLVSGTMSDMTLQQRFRRKDGVERDIEVSVRALRDPGGRFVGTAGSIRDVTKRLQQEMELARSERRLSELAENINDVVFRSSLDGTCQYVTPSIGNMLGYDPRAMIGHSVFAGLHPEDDDAVRGGFEALAKGGRDSFSLSYRQRAKDGSFVWLEANCRALRDASGTPVEVIAAVRDVTGHKKLQEELEDARERAEKAASAKTSFLANISHEIRTPMNGVIGLSDLLLKQRLSPQSRQYAQLISDSGTTMMALLNDILDFTKVDRGLMEIVSEPVELKPCLESARTMILASAAHDNVAINLSIDAALPRFIVSDHLRLRQILANLLGNALKFTAAGQIHIEARTLGGQLEIAITDTGIGIAAHVLPRIFEEFVQADGATAAKYGGSGLGLPIARRLAGAMGGRLTLDSEVGRGTTATLVLPLVASLPPAAIKKLRRPPGLQPRGARILVADDNRTNQLIIGNMLARLGHDAVLVDDGLGVLERVEAAAQSDTPFDLVLMDLQMPGLDGVETTCELRRRGHDPQRLPIIAVTAHAFDEEAAECLRQGFQMHLAKPVRLQALEEALLPFLQVRRRIPA